MQDAKPWKAYEYAVVDLEGTGAQHRESEGIVDICVVPIIDGTVDSPSFHALLDPEIEIPAVVSRIHGIRDADVAGRPKFEQIKEQLAGALRNRVIIAHNASVERRVLSHKMPSLDSTRYIDTIKLARYAIPEVLRFSLDDLIAFFDLERYVQRLSRTDGRHSALIDAQVTATIFVRMMDEYFKPDSTLAELLRISATNTPAGQAALSF